jgi:eukaryotic-like serine/threonine-protein kinase
VTLSAGTHLGPYELVAPLGSGGMGDVYRARDPRLGRDVAIKVLATAVSADLARLRRFEQEARAAAALNHPNIIAVHDVGAHEGIPYVVSELLVGGTLREAMSGGPLPASTTIDYTIQIARGLAAAHDEGIVHRDLKPENVFITRDGRVKILDFGLAKLTEGAPALANLGVEPTRIVETMPGTVLGTVGYMSPEGVRGERADQRTDIFSLGAVMYEMLSGHRPFAEASAIETMSAIVTKDPPDLSSLAAVPSPLVRIVRRCLAKKPEDRFVSARDLAYALDTIADGWTNTAIPAAPHAPRHRVYRIIAAIAALALAAVIGAFAAIRWARPSEVSFRRLTFQRGTVESARFALDGDTVVYSAAWNGNARRIFVTRTGIRESSALALPAGDVVATTRAGEIVLLTGRGATPTTALVQSGTLARASLTGGATRELIEGIDDADASADGSAFAIVRASGERHRLEFPVGRVLYETTGYISSPRISPRGDRVAFLDHPVVGDDRGVVAAVDLTGSRQTLTREWIGEQGLAWTPDGREIWFAAGPGEEPRSVYAVTLDGRVRLVYRAPTPLKIEDVARDGRVLLTGEYFRSDMMGVSAGESRERDLSWFYLQNARALSADGRTLVFSWLSGFNYASYIRKTDGSAAIRLGDGNAQDLSPDGKWVIAASFSSPDRFTLLPTGPGEARSIPLAGVRFDGSTSALWTADGRGIVFVGIEPGRRTRTYLVATDGKPPTPITPEGVVGTLMSPDGQRLVVRAADGRPGLFDVKTASVGGIAGLLDGERLVRWDAAGRSLYVYRPSAFPLRMFRLDIATGRREPSLQISPADPSGIVSGVLLTPDGRSSVYTVSHKVSDLYVVTGLR